ncbi:MAG: [FeFe] hydrogenase H-cluster maturation GTPase HydF [Bacteroidales bacterium]|jgi:[FeFe] hydrogenase H-cluster maturation GTPase HydF|nr:[FeFe] hydrogenase H-cluster maturation GTPase HydF [Bacteroidales bacterium]
MKKGKDIQPHIGIFGRRNVGKSSLINCIIGQDISIVSVVAGTTTDPVKKSIEIPGIGPTIIIDTAGIDDFGQLGELRIKKTKEAIAYIDLAIIILSNNNFGEDEQKLIDEIIDFGTPFIFVHNKSDIASLQIKEEIEIKYKTEILDFCTFSPQIEQLSELIKRHLPKTVYCEYSLLSNLVSYGDIVLLITPIDIEAPEGRLILPQIQTIRDALDNDCIAIILKEKEIDSFLKQTKIKPALVISDTQVILKADASISTDIPLTGFSVLLAHYKGDFEHYLQGTPKIKDLKDGDRILMLESCTHHVSCDDIGRVKIPRWLTNFTGKKLEFDVVSGLHALPQNIKDYALIIQCGGCMITRKQIINRLKPAIDANIPVTNFGMTIAYVQGVYDRVIAPFTGKLSNEDYL